MRTGYVLGISCGYHDSAAALIKNGEVLGACEEERFTGIKHDYSFPTNTINWLFKKYNITKEDLDYISFYENPELKLDRIEQTTKRGGWRNYFKRKRIISNNKKTYKELLNNLNTIKGKDTKMVFGDHHLSHLAYSYYTSPFDEAAILSVDGVGEWETTCIAKAKEKNIQKTSSINFPHSLGMMYSAFTAFLGFKPNEGEYKVMGLAPYGNAITYNKKFLELYKLDKNGNFELNMDYFTYDYVDTHMFNEKLGKLFELPNRIPGEELTQNHKDLAASLQSNYEKIFFTILNNLQKETNSVNLCLGGGCAYNGTANGKILKRTKFEQLYIPPAPSDAGSAIGCALHLSYAKYNIERKQTTSPFLGPYYNKDEIFSAIQKFEDKIYFEKKLHEQIADIISSEITEGNVVGWFQGRMEFGARALGNRSIFANPRDPQMKSRLNRMIKKREGFRPFAPIVKAEVSSKFFNYFDKVPYMNQVVKVRQEHRKQLPAITHVDGSARIQTLDKAENKYTYDLLTELEKKNKFPIVINTSFNLKDQTMVLTPEDAIRTFLNCEMDTLVLSNYIIRKKIL